jgi:protein-S-isoprenylcysteine O-methyltransferase Ste14
MLQLPLVNSEAARAALLLLPVTLWMGLFLRGHFTPRQHAGGLLAFVWQFQASLIISLTLQNQQTSLGLLLGQAMLLGPVNVLLMQQRKTHYAFAISAALLVLYTPYSSTLWPWYFSNLFLACLPALLLASWTANAAHLYLRTALQTMCWACLLLWLFPNTVFEKLNENGWDVLLSRSSQTNLAFLMPMTLPALLLLSAIYQFAVEGRGTGFPYDPPERLVKQGIYAHISNPMQLGICLLMLFWGIALMNVWICASSAVAVFLFIVFKDICNGSCAIGTTDKDWAEYQEQVPKWVPRLKAWKPSVMRQ